MTGKVTKAIELLYKKQLNKQKVRGYIFDSWYDEMTGVHFLVKMFNGKIKAEDVFFVHSNPEITIEARAVGVFDPNKQNIDELNEGCVGFVSTNLKDSKFGINSLGQTLCSFHKGIEPLLATEKPKPIVFASIYPDQPDRFDDFMKAVYKILLEDSSIEIENESSKALGNGIRCGFLGELHLEVFRQRLLDEFSISTICTPPSVKYMITTIKNETFFIQNASDLTDNYQTIVKEYREVFVKVTIISRNEDSGVIYSIVENRRGKIMNHIQISRHQVQIIAEMPLSEIIEDFNTELKLNTKGYGSYEFEFLEYRPTNVVLLKITIMDEDFDAFQFLIHKTKTYDLGKKNLHCFREKSSRAGLYSSH